MIVKLKEGDVVTLKASKNQPEQAAIYLCCTGKGVVLVEVEPEDEYDDGLREVLDSQIEAC